MLCFQVNVEEMHLTNPVLFGYLEISPDMTLEELCEPSFVP